MGCKYMISAFDYPYKGYAEYSKQTNVLVVALFYIVIWSAKHFGVDFSKRGDIGCGSTVQNDFIRLRPARQSILR